MRTLLKPARMLVRFNYLYHPVTISYKKQLPLKTVSGARRTTVGAVGVKVSAGIDRLSKNQSVNR
jgi:hypothetical protein